MGCHLLGFLFSLDPLWPPFLFRYYFPGWHNSSKSLYAHRYGMSKGMESPVMDDCVMAYQFFQVSFYYVRHISTLSLLFSSVFTFIQFVCICVIKN